MYYIKDIKTFITTPEGINLVVIKVETNEPELYGLGCGTFAQRCQAVKTVVDEYLKPLLIGQNVANIEDIWQMVNVNGYWRNGPVLNNALSGIDMALWDIKGKVAGLPVYELFGGKCREGAAAYVHTNAPTREELLEKVQAKMEEGYQYLRCQQGFYGGGKASCETRKKPEGAPAGVYYDPKQYIRKTVGMLEYIRVNAGDDLEIIHDVHERLYPIDAINMAKAVEPYHLFFLEDMLPPEQISWLRKCRSQCATPIAIGELLNNPAEWKTLITEQLTDFIRVHISQSGGLTPARKIAVLADMFKIRIAWHGPRDVSPLGHAANLHLNLSSPNFGAQEWTEFKEPIYEVFEGVPEVRNGYVYPNDKPGLGIIFHEDKAKKYPYNDEITEWTKARMPDGTLFTP